MWVFTNGGQDLTLGISLTYASYSSWHLRRFGIFTSVVQLFDFQITGGSGSLKISESKNCQFWLFEKKIESENHGFQLFRNIKELAVCMNRFLRERVAFLFSKN
jgi:hypothetical protein